MRKYTYIKKIIGIPLEKEGFQYDGFEAGSIWSFSRKKGDITQTIRICQERFIGNQATLEVDTDAYERHAEMLTWAPYEDEEEFEEAMKKFYVAIINEGLDKLEEISTPTTEIRPTVEMESYLFENHEALCREYEEKLQIDDKCTSEMIVDHIIAFLQDHQKDEFSDLKRDFIGMAAVYGEALVRTISGRWVWYDNDRSLVMVKTHISHPLENVIYCWRIDEYGYFKRQYPYLKS